MPQDGSTSELRTTFLLEKMTQKNQLIAVNCSKMVNFGVYGLFLVCFMCISIIFLIHNTFSSALPPSCLLHKHNFCDPSCFQGLPVLRPSRHREDPGSQSAGQRVQPGGKKGLLLHEERSGLPQQVGGRIRATAAAAVRSGKPELFK